MINILNITNCCGCSACASACPKRCITMAEDDEGFLYPKVDESTCVNCGLCEKVCNELHPYNKREPLQVLAAINKNEEVRLRSSSGGIFHLLAEGIIKRGGVVFGARFDENWQVVIDYAENMGDVEAFMGSKYVQARVADAYKDAKRFLAGGRPVLFSGTPCQVAGLHKFLRKPYENLLTVDFICHGTPSPKVWGMYLQEKQKKVQDLCCVEFRNKEKGWKNFSLNLQYNEASKTISILSPFQKNLYMNVFLKNVILRPSCYSCQARSGKSKSDIMIADFWGIDSIAPDMDDDKGTSLVFINTDKGREAMPLDGCRVYETIYDAIIKKNPACIHSPKVNPMRSYFFKHLGTKPLLKLMEKCSKPTRKEKYTGFKNAVKIFIKKEECFTHAYGCNTMIYNKIGKSFNIPIKTKVKLTSVVFRNKNYGWKAYCLELKYSEEDL